MSEQPVLPSRERPAGRTAAVADAILPGGGVLPTGQPPQDTSPGAPTPPSSSTAGRDERIRQATATGGLYAVPHDFGADGGDWQSIWDADPFAKLFLDWRQAERITPEMVRRHYEMLHTFWKEKVQRMQTGAAKVNIVRLYGGPHQAENMVKGYPGEVERAYHRLSTAEGIRAAFDERNRQRLELAYEWLEPLVRHSLADGYLEPSEARPLLQEGERLGLTMDETAEFVYKLLVDRGFQPPTGTRPQGTRAEQVVAVRWSSPDAQRSPRAVNAFRFEHTAVYTLEDLANACERYPEEASRYLNQGFLDKWIAGDLGLAVLADQANRVVSEYRKSTGRALEMFVRAVRRFVGIDNSPRVQSEPRELVLAPIPQGGKVRTQLALRERNGRYAWGRVYVDHEIAGVEFRNRFDGLGVFPIEVDSSWMLPGSYSFHLTFAADGAEEPTRVRVSFEVVPLQVTLTPERLHFAVPFAKAATQVVTIQADPREGVLLGNLLSDEEAQGIDGQLELTGTSGELRVSVDSTRLRAGTRFLTDLLLRTNAGEFTVPVSVEVRFDWTRALLWALLGAVCMSLPMMWVRTMLGGSAGSNQWITSTEQAEGVMLGGGLLASGLLVAVWLAWSARKRSRHAATVQMP